MGVIDHHTVQRVAPAPERQPDVGVQQLARGRAAHQLLDLQLQRHLGSLVDQHAPRCKASGPKGSLASPGGTRGVTLATHKLATCV